MTTNILPTIPTAMPTTRATTKKTNPTISISATPTWALISSGNHAVVCYSLRENMVDQGVKQVRLRRRTVRYVSTRNSRCRRRYLQAARVRDFQQPTLTQTDHRAFLLFISSSPSSSTDDSLALWISLTSRTSYGIQETTSQTQATTLIPRNTIVAWTRPICCQSGTINHQKLTGDSMTWVEVSRLVNLPVYSWKNRLSVDIHIDPRFCAWSSFSRLDRRRDGCLWFLVVLLPFRSRL